MACGVTLSCTELALRLLAVGLASGAILALNAIGITLVYSVVRQINFAHGDLFALLTVVAAWGVAGLGLQPSMPPWLLIGGLVLLLAAVIGTGALANRVVERAAFRPFVGRSRVGPLVATIGISFMLYQAALGLRYLTNIVIPGEHRSVPGIPELPRLRIPTLLPDTDLLALLGLHLQVSYRLRDMLVPLLACGFAAMVAWLLGATRLGRALRATAQDPETARLCGVDPQRMTSLVFSLGGGLAGAAALAHAVYYTHPLTAYGAQSGLFAFTAAVLGGIGRPWGALLASLLLGLVAATSDYFLAAQWTPVLLLGILMLLLLLRPAGLVQDDTEPQPSESPVGRPGLQQHGKLLAGLALVGVVFPLIDQFFDLRMLVIVTSLALTALLAVGMNLVLGQAGLLDLGYAASFGLGAYAAALLTDVSGPFQGRVDLVFVLLVCAGVAGVFGWLNAALTWRLHGEYLAIVTLAFGQIVPMVALNLYWLTGGMRGISALPPPSLAGFILNSTQARYYLVLLVLMGIATAALLLARSRIGRAWAALSMDDLAARSSGVSRVWVRGQAFTLGAAIAGIAGGLFASCFSYISPTQSEFPLTAMVLTIVVVGGVGSVPGALLGTLAIAGYDQIAIPALGAWIQRIAQLPDYGWVALFDPRGLNFLVFGLALYLTVLVREGRRRI